MERKLKILLLSLIINFLIVINVVDSTLNPDGTKCGEKKCWTTEYCSSLDFQCKPCSIICDDTNQSHSLTLCVRECQEYLHDQKYVLRAELGRDGNLRDEVVRLSILVKISFALTIFVTLVIIFMLIKSLLKVEIIREAFVKIFGKKLLENASSNKVQKDVESGGGPVKSQQQNNTRLIVPTISAIVEPQLLNSNGCSTTNTSSTTISEGETIEDNNFESAYDNNLTMTQSPNTKIQFESKRKSSF